jgi:hypothetical protein
MRVSVRKRGAVCIRPAESAGSWENRIVTCWCVLHDVEHHMLQARVEHVE